MAKVMISLPDELLERLDRHAKGSGTTRSGILQRLAAEHLADADAERMRRVEALLSASKPHGGRGADEVRALRRSR